MKELNCRGGDITINGIVQGRAVVAANDRIIIGDAAEFHNGVRYWAGRQYVDFKHSVKSGRAVFDTSLRTGYDRWYLLGFASVLGLLWYLGTVLLMIMIIQYLFGSTMKKAGQTAYNQTLKSLGYGFLFWIGVPVAAALACLTIIGLPVGIILLFSYVLLALFAATITSVVVANWFNNRSDMNWRYWPMVFITLGIFIIVKVLSFIPFLGWFIFAMLACIAFGSILLNVNWRRKQTALA